MSKHEEVATAAGWRILPVEEYDALGVDLETGTAFHRPAELGDELHFTEKVGSDAWKSLCATTGLEV